MKDEIHKVVLIGESGVGKTCIISQFIRNKFDPGIVSSLGEQFVRKKFKVTEDKELLFDLWDTVGQEKHRALTKIFYRDAEAVILVYDITNKKTFEEIKNYWHLAVLENGASDVILALVGNKTDLYENKDVEDEEAIKYANDIGAIFGRTSAKNGSGIKELFEHIGKKIIDPNYDYNSIEENKKNEYEKKKNVPRIKSIKLDKQNGTNEQKSKNSKCC